MLGPSASCQPPVLSFYGRKNVSLPIRTVLKNTGKQLTTHFLVVDVGVRVDHIQLDNVRRVAILRTPHTMSAKTYQGPKGSHIHTLGGTPNWTLRLVSRGGPTGTLSVPERLLAAWLRLSSSWTPRPRCVLRKLSIARKLLT